MLLFNARKCIGYLPALDADEGGIVSCQVGEQRSDLIEGSAWSRSIWLRKLAVRSTSLANARRLRANSIRRAWILSPIT